MTKKVKPEDQGKELVKDIKTMQKQKALQPVKEFLNGVWVFSEGVALLTTALFTLYQARYTEMPVWGAYTLTVAAALVLVPAAMLLGKFFLRAGK